MMPTITLPESYDSKLKQLVTDPFEETRESIVKDLIDQAIDRLGAGSPSPALAADEPLHLNPDNPDSLHHSKVISAIIDGKDVYRPKWNGIREQIHLLALKRLGGFKSLQEKSSARLKNGKFVKDGFKYLPEGDFSIQGVDANWCWRHSLKLARALNFPIKLRIAWRENDAAAHPGETALLEWPG
jgi:hypothetical protein